MKNFIFFILLQMGLIIYLHAQTNDSTKAVKVAFKLAPFDINNFSFSTTIGVGYGLPYGTSISLLKDNLKSMKSGADANTTIKGAIASKIGVLVGADVAYQLFPKTQVEAGLWYNKYGYSYHSSANFRNPDVQEDAEEKWKYAVNINSIAFRLGASHSLSPHIKVDGGLLFGSTLSSKFKSRHTYEHFCNHEMSEDTYIDEKNKGIYYAKKGAVGISLGLEYMPKTTWAYRIGITESGNLTKFGSLHNLQFSLTIKKYFSISKK